MLGHARQYVGRAVGQAAGFPPISIRHGTDCDAKHHAASESGDEELADLQLAKVVHAIEGVDIRALQPIAKHGACIHHKVCLLESAAGRTQGIGSEVGGAGGSLQSDSLGACLVRARVLLPRVPMQLAFKNCMKVFTFVDPSACLAVCPSICPSARCERMCVCVYERVNRWMQHKHWRGLLQKIKKFCPAGSTICLLMMWFGLMGTIQISGQNTS